MFKENESFIMSKRDFQYNEKLNEEIIEEFKQGNRTRENELIINNIPMALKIANKYRRSFLIDSSYDFDDVSQISMLSLLIAVKKYDPIRFDTKLSTFIIPYIEGNLKSAHNRNVSGIRTTRDLKIRINKIISISNRNQIDLSINNAEKFIKILKNNGDDYELEEVIEAIEAFKNIYSKVYIDNVLDDDSTRKDTNEYFLKSDKDQYRISDIKTDISIVLNDLPEKYKEVFKLYFYYDFNQVEISKIRKTSQATVSRQIKKVTDILKERLEVYSIEQ